MTSFQVISTFACMTWTPITPTRSSTTMASARTSRLWAFTKTDAGCTRGERIAWLAYGIWGTWEEAWSNYTRVVWLGKKKIIISICTAPRRSRNLQCQRIFQVNAPINCVCLHPNQVGQPWLIGEASVNSLIVVAKILFLCLSLFLF